MTWPSLIAKKYIICVLEKIKSLVGLATNVDLW